MDTITAAIDDLTFKVWLYRHLRRIIIMPLELKGLKAKAMMFRSALDDVGQAYDSGTDAAKGHASDVRGLADQFNSMREDLDFAIGTVGNSSAVTGLGEPVEQPKQPVAVTDSDTVASIPRLTQAQPEPIVTQAKPLNPLDLQYPNQPPAAVNAANPVMNHTPMARTVPSRRDL